MKRLPVAIGISGIVALAVAVWPAFAQPKMDAPKEAAKALDAAKMTISKAAELAEAHAKGRAVTARAVSDGGTLRINVQVVAGDTVKLVQVDKEGKVTESPGLSELEKLNKDKGAKKEGGGG